LDGATDGSRADEAQVRGQYAVWLDRANGLAPLLLLASYFRGAWRSRHGWGDARVRQPPNPTRLFPPTADLTEPEHS
jgi:hypothetical protein